MSLVNTVENIQQKLANIKSIFAKKISSYEEDSEIDLKLQLKNKYSHVVFNNDEIPDLNEIQNNLFPEPVDLEYQIIENGLEIVSQGFLKKFEESKTEIPKIQAGEIQAPPPQEKKEVIAVVSDKGTPYSFDVVQLFKQLSDSNEKMLQYFKREESPQVTNNSSPEYIESLRNQITDLKEMIRTQKEEYQVLFKEMKAESESLRKDLFTSQMENIKLSVLVNQNANNNGVSPEAKFEEFVRNYERTQKKFAEMTEEKKKEIEALNLTLIENKIKASIKNDKYVDNIEVDKAVAEVIRSKVPTLLDRGIDLFLPAVPSGQNGQSTAPAII